MLPFEDARAKVAEILRARTPALARETIELAGDPAAALGRILAEEVVADRNYPPFDRSTRDGFAVRSADAEKPGARLRVVGESRAGVAFGGSVGQGECVVILTGAAVPAGADAVVMQEYTQREGEFMIFERVARRGQNVVPAGSEARAGQVVVPLGARLGYAELAMAAQVGCARARVHRKARVAVLSTGDEIVGVTDSPGPFQIRNSNGISLASQIALAGGEAVILGNARDEVGDLRRRIERGLAEDVLVLSGGVSVGKYDLVEQVLRDLGAEFFFDAIAIRPGRPAVFGWCRGKPVFGLPGNPVSTMVTFELLVVPAIRWLGGCEPEPLPIFKARLARPVEQKAALTHFLPARVNWTGDDPVVEELPWEGSGDIVALVRGNCFLVVHESKLKLAAGDWVDVLPRRGVF